MSTHPLLPPSELGKRRSWDRPEGAAGSPSRAGPSEHEKCPSWHRVNPAKLLLSTALIVASLFVPARAAQAAPRDAQVLPAVRALERSSGAALSLRRSKETGLVTFITTAPDRPMRFALSKTAPAVDVLSAFLVTGGQAVGITAENEIAIDEASPPDLVGISHLRLHQEQAGIPIATAGLTIHIKDGTVVAVHARTVPDTAKVDLVPRLSRQQARAIVKSFVGGKLGFPDAKLGKSRLELLNVGFVLGRLSAETRLAWFVEARAPGLREFVWVDAIDGSVALHLSQLTSGRNRRVYSSLNSSNLPGTLVRAEGAAATGDKDADAAYNYSGDTWSYFFNEHGRDSFDGQGAALISTVHFCEGGCPYANAFWDGTQMVYGEGFAAADDVDAHELTHAVTERTANLIYCLQPGALNESFSDMFGETVDLGNAGGTDTAQTRWQIGEDIPLIGAFRNMMNPNAHNDPAKVSDSRFICYESCDSSNDQGGVHSNSGVPNHAYALLADGGSYNGITVTGIGLTKAGKIAYRALVNYLTTSSNFNDAYDAFRQSCTDLIGTSGIIGADCTQVKNALDAVEMGGEVCPPPSVCGDGQVEDSETCDDGNTTDGDGCDSNCSATACGNGVVSAGEACDDGGVVGGDGCESDCSLSPGCSLTRGTGLPIDIRDTATTNLSLAVAGDGPVSYVRVLGLRGTHTYVKDLRFTLSSPSGQSVNLIDRACGGEDDFFLGLSDEATTVIPCPLTDGGLHRPQQALAQFAGTSAAGSWTLAIDDLASFDVGRLESVSLEVCRQSTLCGNGTIDPPETCDDGAWVDGDGCTATCTLENSGCTVTTADPLDLPEAIPDLGSVTSSLSVASSGRVGSVSLVELNGTHTWMGDLRFTLTGPDGTSQRVINHICGSADNFNLDLDDSATSTIPCPPTDGQAHLPNLPLSIFAGRPGGGTWTLTVVDSYASDTGWLIDWGLRICTVNDCGNGILQAGEDCDDGNGSSGDCCSASCTIEPTDTLCRPAANECDLAEDCATGTGICPADSWAMAGSPCADDGEICSKDRCDGNGVCEHAPDNAGEICRPTSGPCDEAEICTGLAPACPTEAFASDGRVCRMASNECDLEETCTGAAAACPADAFEAPGISCDDDGWTCSTGTCDGASQCVHQPKAQWTVCRDAATACDVSEVCDGETFACPVDTGEADADGDGECDAEDPCTTAADIIEPAPGAWRLRLTKIGLDPVAGDDTLTLTGSAHLPAGVSFSSLRMAETGARFVIDSQSGVRRVDLTLPPGAFTAATARGWRTQISRIIWQDRSPRPFGGISKFQIQSLDPSDPASPLWITMTGKAGTFPVVPVDAPITASLTFGDTQAAVRGWCATQAFASTECSFQRQQTTLSCRH